MLEQLDEVCMGIDSDNKSEDFESDFAADLDLTVTSDSKENGNSDWLLLLI